MRTKLAWVGVGLFLVALAGVPLVLFLNKKPQRGEVPSPATAEVAPPRGRVVEGTITTMGWDGDSWLTGKKGGAERLVLELRDARGISVVCLFAPGTGPNPLSLSEGDRMTVRGTPTLDVPDLLKLENCEVLSHRPWRP